MSEIKVNSIKGVGASAAAITVDNSSGSCAANITSLNGGQFANRNIILNGEFLVSQRASSETSVAGNLGFTYNTVDRFVYGRSTDAVVNLAQEDDAPVGFKKCLQLRVTTVATAASTSYARLVYRIEDSDVYRFGFGQSGTRFLTLSFYHKHTQAGTSCVMIQNPGYNRSYIAEYTQSVANTWERATITFPVDTGNHWTPSGGRGMQIQWGLTDNDAQGSANAWTSSNIVVTSNQYNHLGAVDNYFRITGIQLELGSVATDFEHRSFAQELQLCHRYYQQYPESTGDGYGVIFNGYIPNSTTVQGGLFFPEMRSSPTISNSGNFRILHQSSALSVSSFSYYHSQKTSLNPQAITSASLTVGQGAMVGADNDSTARIKLSAEL
ncbi:putative carbohydrate binding domain containing protein [uncultured Mediterranean phage uvMED]|nr:putative carbohydrate binding domain containing protein [uncultured Mediterranean phage uvMED]